MARIASRIYVPLDIAFFDDDKVVEAGEAAAYLYLVMMTRAKHLDSDGVLTRGQIEKLHVKGWQRRLETLVRVGLIEQAMDAYGIVNWLKWNESKDSRAARLQAERERKAAAKGDGK